jgi:hypothetical protein
MSNQHEEQELTQEELAARKEEMKAFYDDSLPYLESQSKYEKFLTEIEEARFRRATIQIQWANIMAAQQEQDTSDREDGPEDSPEEKKEDEKTAEQVSPTAERKLKRS